MEIVTVVQKGINIGVTDAIKVVISYKKQRLPRKIKKEFKKNIAKVTSFKSSNKALTYLYNACKKHKNVLKSKPNMLFSKDPFESKYLAKDFFDVKLMKDKSIVFRPELNPFISLNYIS